MISFSRSLKFACLSAVLVLGACTHKQEAVNTAPPPAPPPAAQPAPAPVTSRIVPGSAEDFRVNVGDTVHFAFDQYNVEDNDKSILSRQAAWLSKYPSVRVTIHNASGTCACRYSSTAREAEAKSANGSLIAVPAVPSASSSAARVRSRNLRAAP